MVVPGWSASPTTNNEAQLDPNTWKSFPVVGQWLLRSCGRASRGHPMHKRKYADVAGRKRRNAMLLK